MSIDSTKTDTAPAATEPLHVLEPVQTIEASIETTTPLVDSPANQDEPPMRPSQPTEKFDLHRIKSIVAKDSQKKEVVANRRSKLEDESGEPLGIPLGRKLPNFSLHQESLGSMLREKLTRPLSLLAKLPAPLRPVTVAILSALLTILVLLAFNSSTTKSTEPLASTPEPITATAPAAHALSSGTDDSVKATIIDLPEGR
jgi:hypothetical protein